MTSTAKRPRTEESNSTSVTSKLDVQSARKRLATEAPVIIPTTVEQRVLIRPYTECISRVSVSEFFYDEKRKEERDLFLRAMSNMMNNTDTDDPWSYYAIAGIHGLPQKVYDSAESPGAKGYCEHGTVLFPTWHRPYILLFEQAIIREAITIANELNDAASINKCLEIANSLRMPYLDWESSFTAYQGLPDVFTRTSIDVTYPQDTTTTIPNPLRSYVLPVNLSKPISASDVFNPTAKPNYQIPETLTPFTPASYPTVRHPDNTYQSSVDALNLAVQRSCNLVLRPQLFAVMLQTDWAKFSNHFSDPVDGKIINNKEFYGHFASIEVIHDAFHDTVGGSGGHMTYPDVAAFDPIFWFHHCNVDRLLAMWQYANPKSYVPDPGATGTDDKNNKSPLIPFWSYESFDKGERQYLNSLDVQSIDKWNYTYHAIEQAKELKWSPEKMKCYIMAKFFPDNHYGIRWYLNILRLPKHLDVGPYEARVFIDLPSSNIDTPLSSPNYAGLVSVFARSRDSHCMTCEKVPYTCGSVELTSTMKRLGIVVDTEVDGIISQENPPNNPFGDSLEKFTLVYVTAANKEIKLEEEPLNDSTGKRKTKPTLYLSWMAFTDARAIARGDMKPKQMDKELNSLYGATTSETRKPSEISYTGGIIEPKPSIK